MTNEYEVKEIISCQILSMILRFQLALNIFTLSSASVLIFNSSRAPSAIKHNLSVGPAALRYVLSRLISSEQEQPTNWQRKGEHQGRIVTKGFFQ